MTMSDTDHALDAALAENFEAVFGLTVAPTRGSRS